MTTDTLPRGVAERPLSEDTDTITIQRIYSCKCTGVRFGIRRDLKAVTHWATIDGRNLVLYTDYFDRKDKPISPEELNTLCPNCGFVMVSNDTFAVLNPEGHCDLRCEFAVGSQCTCSCGGPNHGIGWLDEG